MDEHSALFAICKRNLETQQTVAESEEKKSEEEERRCKRRFTRQCETICERMTLAYSHSEFRTVTGRNYYYSEF